MGLLQNFFGNAGVAGSTWTPPTPGYAWNSAPAAAPSSTASVIPRATTGTRTPAPAPLTPISNPKVYTPVGGNAAAPKNWIYSTPQGPGDAYKPYGYSTVPLFDIKGGPDFFPKVEGVDWTKMGTPYRRYNPQSGQWEVIVHGSNDPTKTDDATIWSFADPNSLRSGGWKNPTQSAYDSFWNEINAGMKGSSWDPATRDLVSKFGNYLWQIPGEDGQVAEWTPEQQDQMTTGLSKLSNASTLESLYNKMVEGVGYEDPELAAGNVLRYIPNGATHEEVTSQYGQSMADSLAATGFIQQKAGTDLIDGNGNSVDTSGTGNEDLSASEIADMIARMGFGGLLGSQYGNAGADNSDLLGILMSALQGQNSSQLQPLDRPSNQQPALTSTPFI